VIVALADTHATGAPPLSAHLRETIREADLVLHAGDFTARATLDAFRDLAEEFAAVHGNSDGVAVREELPAVRTVEALGERILLVHGHEHDRTRLSLLARQEKAGVVVVGHTHRPGTVAVDSLRIVNPGSHADPRGGQPAYARIRRGAETAGVDVELRSPAGDVL
jgi:putative phosphoesterase